MFCVHIFCFSFSEEMPRFSPSGFFGPSRCLIPTPVLTSEYPHLCSVCVCVRIHTHTPTYTPTRVNNGEDTDNTPISPSVKNKPLRQATNAWPGLAEIPHLRSPTLDEQTRVVRWKTRRAFKMAPRHHAFTQKRKAQPIWI